MSTPKVSFNDYFRRAQKALRDRKSSKKRIRALVLKAYGRALTEHPGWALIIASLFSLGKIRLELAESMLAGSEVLVHIEKERRIEVFRQTASEWRKLVGEICPCCFRIYPLGSGAIVPIVEICERCYNRPSLKRLMDIVE